MKLLSLFAPLGSYSSSFEDNEEEKNGKECKLETFAKYTEITPLFGNTKKIKEFHRTLFVK